MLGLTPEDQEMAHVAHHLMPDTIAASVQQEEKRIKLTLTKRTEMLKEAFQCFEKGHQLDPMNPELLCCLASCYHRGSGVDEDEDEAVGLYRRAADMGDAAAQYCLGVLYDSGEGVSQDSAQAATWLRKAAEQGNTDAQVSLAFAYKESHGVERNCAQAAIWLRMAATSGDEFAQDELQDSAELYGFSDRVDDPKEPSSPMITRPAEQPSKKLSPEQKEGALSEFKRIQDEERLQARPATAKRKED
jgi:TPR repeat protein